MVLNGAGALATASENVHEEEETNHKYLFFNRAHRRGKIIIKIAKNTIRKTKAKFNRSGHEYTIVFLIPNQCQILT